MAIVGLSAACDGAHTSAFAAGYTDNPQSPYAVRAEQRREHAFITLRFSKSTNPSAFGRVFQA